MGFKLSKCLKEKADQEFSKSASTVSKTKKQPISPDAMSRTRTSKSPHTLPPDRSIPDIIGNFNCKNDKRNCPIYPELFENEDQSDVTFLVGSDCWRFPGHKHVLASASPVFGAMLKGPLSSTSTKEEIPIEDVDPRAFENILRFIYIGEVKLLTITSTLDTLYATDKYMIPELTRLCLEVLEFSLSVNNVLSIHHGIRLFCSVWSCHQADIKGREMDNQDKGQDTPQSYIPVLHTLQNRCLEIIDNYAEQILTCEDLDNLSHEEVSEIVLRDTLQVNRETSVFEALHRWTIQQCKCNQKELTWTNKRDCLTSTLYAVRYLLMTKEEFVAGPGSTELLTNVEKDWILATIMGKDNPNIPAELISRKTYLERRRGYPPAVVTGDECKETENTASQGPFSNLMTTKPYIDPWCDTGKSKNKKQCCRISKVFTECFVCFSLLFD